MKSSLTVLLVLLLGGCTAPKTLYTWGSYEELIYQSYRNPGESPPEQQIEMLERDFEIAKSNNTPVPPGWHAHLGYLYALTGKRDEAVLQLRAEKEQFPESAVFVDRMLANLGTPGSAQ